MRNGMFSLVFLAICGIAISLAGFASKHDGRYARVYLSVLVKSVLWRGLCGTLRRVVWYFEEGCVVLWRGWCGTLKRVMWYSYDSEVDHIFICFQTFAEPDPTLVYWGVGDSDFDADIAARFSAVRLTTPQLQRLRARELQRQRALEPILNELKTWRIWTRGR